jgi:class 3 adenylate cyclase
VGDERVRLWHRRFERQSASPGALRAHLDSALKADITGDLDRVTCPVFIGHCRGDQIVPVATSRYLADRFPNATVRIWDAQDHDLVFSSNWADFQADMIEFITGSRPAAVARGRFGVVLFTDIAGSTAEAIAAGDDRWARLIAAHDAVADLVIDEYAGRRVKSTGDGLLAIFDDPVNAVECTSRLLDRLAEIGLQVRAGLHAGQVQIHDNGDISGAAVNIAARVEPLAGPGCICVSRTMADLLMGEDFAFDALGEHELKGIDQPIEVYTLAAQ